MAAPGENLRINGDRLWDSIHAIAEIGPGIAGGSNRGPGGSNPPPSALEVRAVAPTSCRGHGRSRGTDAGVHHVRHR